MGVLRPKPDPPFNWTGNEELLSQLLQHGDSWGEGEPHSTLRNLYAQLVSLERVTQMWQSKHHIQAAIYVRSIHFHAFDFHFFCRDHATKSAPDLDRIWSKKERKQSNIISKAHKLG